MSMSFCPSTIATRSSSCCVALNNIRFIQSLQSGLDAPRFLNRTKSARAFFRNPLIPDTGLRACAQSVTSARKPCENGAQEPECICNGCTERLRCAAQAAEKYSRVENVQENCLIQISTPIRMREPLSHFSH